MDARNSGQVVRTKYAEMLAMKVFFFLYVQVQSPWDETVPELKRWQAAWAKRAWNREPQVEFALSDSPWERPCFNSGTLPCSFFPSLDSCCLKSHTALRTGF